MFDGRLPSFANTRSMRVAGGLGTVARVVGDAQEIYDQRIAVSEALRRIEGLYKPYHRALRNLFMRLHREFGAAMLIDCHSMPSATGAKDERPRADLVLGDRYGTSCVPVIAETIEATMRGFGYVVSRNKPYAGGFITEHYGNPSAGLHAIQLEVNRALYMDERRYQRAASFARLAADSRSSPIGSRKSRSRNCDPIGRPQPNSLTPSAQRDDAARAYEKCAQESQRKRRKRRHVRHLAKKRAAHLAGAAQV